MGQDGDDIWWQLGQLKCKKCRFVTSEQGLMQAHACRKPKIIQSARPFIKYSSSSGEFTCSLCSFHALEHNFVLHLQQHLLTSPLRCDACTESFTTMADVRQHIISQHPSAPGNYSLCVSDKTGHILKNAKENGWEFFIPWSQAVLTPPLSNISSCDNGKQLLEQHTDKTLAYLPPCDTPPLAVSTSSESKVCARENNPVTLHCISSTISSHQSVGSPQVSVPLSLSCEYSNSSSHSSQCAITTNPNQQRGARPLETSTSSFSKARFNGKDKTALHSLQHADPTTVSNNQHISTPPFSNLYSNGNSTGSTHSSHIAITTAISNLQQSGASDQVLPPVLPKLTFSEKSRNLLYSSQGAKSQFNPHLLHPLNNTRIILIPYQQRRMPCTPVRFVPYPHGLYQRINLNEKENHGYNQLMMENGFHPVHTSKVDVSGDSGIAVNSKDTSAQTKSSSFVQAPESSVPNESNVADGNSKISCNTAQTNRSSSPVQTPMTNVSTESQVLDVNSNFGGCIQASKNALHGELNSNVCNAIQGCCTGIDEKLLDDCISFFYVVNDTCICSKCQERFRNVDLFYQHIHKDLHTLFQICCPTGYSKDCNLLQKVISKLDEKSLGQLKRMEFARTVTGSEMGLYDKHDFLELGRNAKEEQDASENQHGMTVIKKEECEEVSDMIRDGSFPGDGSTQRHSCDAIVKEECPDATIIAKRHHSCDSWQQFQHNTIHQIPPDIAEGSHQTMNIDFEAMEDDLVKFSCVLNEQMNKEFYKCAFPNCQFSSHQSIHLLIHMESEHGNDEEFLCIYCGFVGDKVTDLVHHIALHNSSESRSYSGSLVIKSNSCDSQPISCVHQNLNSFVFNLEKQKEANNEECYFLCDICRCPFSSVSKLKTHVETSSLKTYGCKLCSSIFLNSKSFEKHFLDNHPGRSRFNRVIVNFLCQFRKNNYLSFCKIIKQYVSTKVNTYYPCYSPISEALSQPASPLTSATHHVEANDLLPSSQKSTSGEKCTVSPVNKDYSNSLILISSLASGPAGSSVSESCVISSASEPVTHADTCSESRPTNCSGSAISLTSKSDSQLCNSIINVANTFVSFDKEPVDSTTTCDAHTSSATLPMTSFNDLAVSVMSNPTVLDNESAAATAPVCIENNVDFIESAKQISSENELHLLSSEMNAECTASSQKSIPCSISPSHSRSLEGTQCDMEGNGTEEDLSGIPWASVDTPLQTKAVHYKCKFCDYQCEWDPENMLVHLRNSRNHLFYKCYYCPNPYYDQRTLKNHIRYHHENEPFMYKEFGIEETFSPILEKEEVSQPQKQKLKKQVQILVTSSMEGVKSGKEAICPQEIKSGNDVHPTKKCNEIHHSNHTQKKKLNIMCKRCKREFSSVYSVEDHFTHCHVGKTVKWVDLQESYNIYSSSGKILGGKDVMESPTKRYLCNLCSYRSETRSSVHKHQYEAHKHYSRRAIVIKLHGFSTYTRESSSNGSISSTLDVPSSSSLVKEGNYRKDPLRYNCNLCSASLSSEFFLRNHLAKHGGFKHTSTLSPQDGLLICAYCGYIAHSNIDLVNHVASHATDRRYKCSLCNWESHHKKDVSNHIEKRHKGETGKVMDREKRRGKAMKLSVVNIDPVVLLKRLQETDF